MLLKLVQTGQATRCLLPPFSSPGPWRLQTFCHLSIPGHSMRVETNNPLEWCNAYVKQLAKLEQHRSIAQYHTSHRE